MANIVSAEFAARIKDLKDDQWGMKGPGKAAAEFFREAAVKGLDISAVIPDLMQAYLDSHQLPIMCPIADALTVHYMKMKEVAKLGDLLKRKAFGSYVLTSIRNLAGRGTSPEWLIPTIIEAFNVPDSEISRYDFSRTLKPYVKRSRARLFKVAQAMAEGEMTAEILPWFLREVHGEKADDFSEFFPLLLRLFKKANDHLKSEIAAAMIPFVYHGSSFDPVRAEVEEFLKEKDEEVRANIAYALTWYYLNIHDTKAIDALVSHADPIIRERSLFALSGSFNQKKLPSREIAGRLAKALLDPIEKVRSVAATGLEHGLKLKVDVGVDESLLALLVDSLNDPQLSVDLSKYLYACASQDKKLSATLFQLLSGANIDRDLPVVKELLKACSDSATGNLVEACSICKGLPRDREYSQTYEVPPEVEQLQDLAYGGLKQCPACKTYYYYHFSQEYDSSSDGMGMVTEITVRRLSPPDALARLKDGDLKKYQQNYDRFIAECHKNLTHTYPYIRENASWDLFHHYRARNQNDRVCELLSHGNPSVRTVVSEMLSEKSADPVPFLAVLTQGLTDAEAKVRKNCAMALGRYYLSTNQIEKVHELLAFDDPAVKQMAVYHIAVNSEQMDNSPFVPVLKTLIVHPNQQVRTYTSWALGRVSVSEAPSVIEHLVSALKNQDSGVRGDSLSTLSSLAAAERDISPAIPGIAGLLLDESEAQHISVSYLARKALQAASAAGGDITPAFDNLVKLLNRSGDSGNGDISYSLILPMEGVDHSKTVPAYARMLQKKSNLRNPALDALERLAEGRGTDISAAVKDLKNLLLDDTEYDRRRALNALTWHCLNRQRWREIQTWLKHDRKDIRANSTAVLRDSAKKGTDISPLLPLMVKNMNHEYEYLRGTSVEGQFMFLQHHKEFAGQVLELLAKLKTADQFPEVQKLAVKCSEILGVEVPQPMVPGPVREKRATRSGAAGKSVSTKRAELKKSQADHQLKTEPEPALIRGERIAPTEEFPLSHLQCIYNERTVQIGLFREFDRHVKPTSFLDVLADIEAFNKKYGTRLKLISHALADFLLMKTDFWPSLKDYSPFVTDTIIAYEAPGKDLGAEVCFEFEKCPRIRLPTGTFAGSGNIALLMTNLQTTDFTVSGNEITIQVQENRIIPLRGFPDEGGWCLPDPETKIPCGWVDTTSPEARKLSHRLDRAFIGPVGRGIQFGGFHADDRRLVMAGNFAFIDNFAVLVEQTLP